MVMAISGKIAGGEFKYGGPKSQVQKSVVGKILLSPFQE
jgi:hypothetical protein